MKGTAASGSVAISPALPESEARFRTMADHAPVLLWMAGRNGSCEFFNQGWLDFTGRSLSQELGTGWAEGVHPEDLQRCMHVYFEAFVERRPFTMEYRLRRHDGEYRWIYDQGAPRYDTDSTFAGYIGSCVDITDQRRARDALKRLATELEARVEERTQLAREREVLLREVHHRVKNDLQLISSILNMQRRKVSDSSALAALEDTDARVQTIAQIHEHMYGSKNLGRLSFSQNVRSMAAGLVRLAGPAQAINLELDVEDDVWLPVDRAIPYGLILNELLRNCLKHAFPEDGAGTIRVLLHRRDSDGWVILTVEDDGVGTAQENQARNGNSFGWQLVEAFVEQLGAELNVDHAAGLRISVAIAGQGDRKRRES